MGPKSSDLKGMKSISSVVDLFLLYLLTTFHFTIFAPSSSPSKVSAAEPMLENKPVTGVLHADASHQFLPLSYPPCCSRDSKITLEILEMHFPPGKERESLHKVQPRIHEPALLPQSQTTSKASHHWEYPGELVGLIISLSFLAITGGVRGSYQTRLCLITSSLPPSCFWHPLLEVFHCQLLQPDTLQP